MWSAFFQRKMIETQVVVKIRNGIRAFLFQNWPLGTHWNTRPRPAPILHRYFPPNGPSNEKIVTPHARKWRFFPLKIWIMHTSIRSEHSAVAEQPWTLGANKRYVGVSYSLLILYLCIIIRTYVSLFKKFGNILVSEFHTDLETCSVRENSYVLSSKLII